MKNHSLPVAALLACTALGAAAQGSSVTLYGTIDQYANYMRSSSGARVKSLEDGAYLRSRLGLRGVEVLGSGLVAKFQLEGGFSADTGAQADATRFFDRQAWVGIGSPWGEVRVGRQNGPIFYRGNYVDYTTRTLGSMVNVFGVPSRYDNAVSYYAPRFAGISADVQVAIPEAPSGNRAVVLQGGIDWSNDVFRAGYMGLRGRPQARAAIERDVVYDQVFGNWMYGKGTVYLTYVRSNNNTASAASNNGAAILGNVGGFNAGTDPNLRNFYGIWQVSADYRITDLLRVGALVGKIDDKSGRDRGATGGSIATYYDLSKRTMLLAMAETIHNDSNGGWRPAGSAGLKTTFTAPGDVNGRRIDGLHLGILHRF